MLDKVASICTCTYKLVELCLNGCTLLKTNSPVQGYKHRNAYIATQAPLPNTVNDFWRMIWEFKSKIIVMLCNILEDNQEASYPYWPTKVEDNEKYGNITVTMQSKATYGEFSVRKFNLQEDKVCALDTL